MLRNSDRKFAVFSGLFLAAILIGLTVLFGNSIAPAQAALPTPVSMSDRTDQVKFPITFWSSHAMTASAGSTAIELPSYEVLDLQYIIDQTDGNTTTLKIQYSNDNSNWTDGATIVSNNGADAAALDQYANFGRYTRVYATLTDSDIVTVTAIAVGK